MNNVFSYLLEQSSSENATIERYILINIILFTSYIL